VKIAFYGSSLLSSYWNGAATYYRGMLSALAQHGHTITFYEPDAFDRQQHRDIDPPDWCEVEVYPATDEGVRGVIPKAALADVVVKASGVGVYDDVLLEGVIAASRPGAVRMFCDVDAPATLVRGLDAPTHVLIERGVIALAEAKTLAGIEEASDDGVSLRLSTRHPDKLLSALAERGALEGLQVRGATLEDVFLDLTGREYRA